MGDGEQERARPSLLKQDDDADGEAAASATTTEQTGRPGGAGHPRLIKYNGLRKRPFLPVVWQPASGGR